MGIAFSHRENVVLLFRMEDRQVLNIAHPSLRNLAALCLRNIAPTLLRNLATLSFRNIASHRVCNIAKGAELTGDLGVKTVVITVIRTISLSGMVP